MKIDMNLLPEEYRPKRWVLPLTVALALFVLAAIYYGYGFYAMNASANNELERLQSQLDSVNTEIQKVMADPTMKEYEERIGETRAEIDKLKVMERDYETRNAERIYWKPVIQTIRELAPTDVTIISFGQNEDEITIEGELSSEVQDAIVIVEYAKKLQNRGIFARPPAFEIEIEEITEDGKTQEIFIFTMLLQVKPGGQQ